ncbi:SPOR domain-containing protein [Endothiovibrio diazotrophicus]
MECHPLNQRTLLLLIALAAVALTLAFTAGYYGGLKTAITPSPPKELTEDLLTAFLEAPRQETPATPAAAGTAPPVAGDSPLTAPIPIPTMNIGKAIEAPSADSGTAQAAERPMATEPPSAATAASPAVNTVAQPPATPAAATPFPAPPEATPEPTAPADESPIVGYSVQVGSYSEQPHANESVEEWQRAGYAAFVYHTVSSNGRRWHTVRIGRYESREEAAEMAERIRKEKGVQAVTVPLVQR